MTTNIMNRSPNGSQPRQKKSHDHSSFRSEDFKREKGPCFVLLGPKKCFTLSCGVVREANDSMQGATHPCPASKEDPAPGTTCRSPRMKKYSPFPLGRLGEVCCSRPREAHYFFIIVYPWPFRERKSPCGLSTR